MEGSPGWSCQNWWVAAERPFSPGWKVSSGPADLKIINMYGLTETSPIITINRTEKGRCKLGSVGSVIDGVELKIADDGEILCKGDCVMMGYYKDEEQTRKVI